MDNPASESNTPLDTNQAAAAFASLLSDEPPKADQGQQGEAPAESAEDAAARLAAEELAAENKSEPGSEASSEQPQKFTVKIDGKDVEVTLDEMRNGYQRQADYTRKSMEAAELRKAADAEANAARQERQQYAQNLQVLSQQLQGVLQEQSQINWQQLLESDPTEYLKQRHLFEQRQAAFQRTQGEQQRIWQQQQAEQAQNVSKYLAEQHQAMLDKLPEWKDDAKAQADKKQITDFLANSGFKPEEIGNIADHRLVLLARNAMKYEQLISRAKEATKKVEKLPPKVERPGNGDAAKPDGRSAAMQRLSKSGRVEDAAAVFAQFL